MNAFHEKGCSSETAKCRKRARGSFRSTRRRDQFTSLVLRSNFFFIIIIIRVIYKWKFLKEAAPRGKMCNRLGNKFKTNEISWIIWKKSAEAIRHREGYYCLKQKINTTCTLLLFGGSAWPEMHGGRTEINLYCCLPAQWAPWILLKSMIVIQHSADPVNRVRGI